MQLDDDSVVDPIEAMIASGKFSDSTDVTEVAALLAGEAPADKDDPSDKDETPAAAPVDNTETPPAKEAPAAASDTTEAADDADLDEADPASFKANPIYGVLKGTRQTLAQTRAAAKAEKEALEARNAELQRQNDELLAKVNTKSPDATAAVQQAADAAGLVDEHGNAIDVSKIDIEALRENYDGPLVDAIAALQGVVSAQANVIGQLKQRDVARSKTEAELVQESLQHDIDSVPLLAQWQVDEDQAMYNAAIAVDDTLRTNPAWAAKPRVERFQEVVRRLGGNAQPQKQAGAEQVRQSLATAAARATPTSLSEMPSGTPAAQNEFEALEKLDITQLAEKMSTMTPAQQEKMLERLG